MRRSLGFALTAAAISGGAALIDQWVIGRWKKNPDPLAGRPPMVPEGTQRWVITDDDANIHTVTIEPDGDAEGTIMLVHGLTSNLEDWGPIAEHLLDLGFTVIAVDQRGHGKSIVGADGYSPAILGADLAAVLTQLDISDAMVVGHSMGGMATMTLALNHRSVANTRVHAIGLISTTASLTGARSEVSLRLGALSLTDRFTAMKDKLRLGAGLMVFGETPSLFMVDQGIRSSMSCPDETRRGATAGLVGYDLTDRIGTIAVPTLVIHGAADRMVPVDAGRYIAATVPDVELRVFEGAGHMMIWEHWREIAERIATFSNGLHTHDDVLDDRTDSDR